MAMARSLCMPSMHAVIARRQYAQTLHITIVRSFHGGKSLHVSVEVITRVHSTSSSHPHPPRGQGDRTFHTNVATSTSHSDDKDRNDAHLTNLSEAQPPPDHTSAAQGVKATAEAAAEGSTDREAAGACVEDGEAEAGETTRGREGVTSKVGGESKVGPSGVAKENGGVVEVPAKSSTQRAKSAEKAGR